MQRIFASKERREVLDDFGVDFKVDQELNFIFPNEEVQALAESLLREALEL